MLIKNKLKIINLSDIKPYKNNAKIHTPEQIELIKQSLEKHDYYAPIAVDSKNVIVLGHGRYEALKQMNGKKIEVVDLSYLKPKEIKKLRILDNKIVSNEWDKDLLQAEIEAIYNGFDDMEKIADELSISEKELNDLMPTPETEGDDEIPEEVEKITKLGDLWELGRHRLLCGDSTKEEDVNRLMDGKKADMVFTDPPYGVDYQSNMRVKTQKFDKLENDNILIDGWIELANNNNNGFMFVWTSWKVSNKWRELINNITNIVIWNKGGGGIGDLKKTFLTDYEMALVCNNGNEILGKRIGSVWTIGKDNANSYKHPTQKPVDLGVMAIENVTLNNHTVLDLFLGSGSTLIACEKTNRICYGMELDEHYCDVIVQRYIDFCTKNGINIEIKHNGKEFNTGITQNG